jgi:hypothetical protein
MASEEKPDLWFLRHIVIRPHGKRGQSHRPPMDLSKIPWCLGWPQASIHRHPMNGCLRRPFCFPSPVGHRDPKKPDDARQQHRDSQHVPQVRGAAKPCGVEPLATVRAVVSLLPRGHPLYLKSQRPNLFQSQPRARHHHPGDDRARTGNLRLAKPALSQLSYVPLSVLPFLLAANWAREDSNLRPRPYQGRALTN